MYDVFISHSTNDKKWADAACSVLEGRGIRCWIAPRDIVPGIERGAAIITGIDSCKVLVLIFSASANESPNVRREVERAISKGRPILPCRFENINPVGSLEFALGNTHWLDVFTPPVEEQMTLLAKSAEALLAQNGARSEKAAALSGERTSIGRSQAVPGGGQFTTSWLGKPGRIAAAAIALLLLLAVGLSAAFWPRKTAAPMPDNKAAAADKVEARQPDVVKGAPAEPNDEGFVPLFNGKDLTGWQPNMNWVAANGVLIGSSLGGRVSDLLTERDDFKDFRLRVEARINDGGNSGVFFRIHPNGDERYEAQINSTHADPNKTGSLYPAANNVIVPYRESIASPNEWFRMEILAVGNHIVIKVNGVTTADYRDVTRHLTKGRIGLQLHNPKTEVEFAKIDIHELPAEVTTASSPAIPASPQPSPTNSQPGVSSESRCLRVLKGHAGPVKHVLFTPDSARVISASNTNHDENKRGATVNDPGNDNTVRVWQVESGKQVRVFFVKEGIGYGPQGIALSPDGRFVAACTSWDWGGRSYTQPRVFVWDIANGKRKYHFALKGTDATRGVGFSSDNATLYAVRDGKQVHAWSMESGKASGTVELERHNQPTPFGTMFVAGGRYVLGGGWKGVLRLWDRETGKDVRSFEGHTKLATGWAVSPDGTHVLSAAGDFSVRMWDFETGHQVFALENLDSVVSCVAFSPDGKDFMTGEVDGALRMYDTATRKELARFTGHAARVNSVAYSPDGRLAASGSNDKTVRVWRLP
jgi:WD40 repeat protein